MQPGPQAPGQHPLSSPGVVEGKVSVKKNVTSRTFSGARRANLLGKTTQKKASLWFPHVLLSSLQCHLCPQIPLPCLHQETPARPWEPLGRKPLLPQLWSPSRTLRPEAGVPRVPGRRLASQQPPRPVSREWGEWGTHTDTASKAGPGRAQRQGALRVLTPRGGPVRPEGLSAGSPGLGSPGIRAQFFPGTSGF